MSCLSITTQLISEPLILEVTNLGGMNVVTTLYGDYISPIIKEISERLNISCSIVCNLADVNYLHVSPEI